MLSLSGPGLAPTTTTNSPACTHISTAEASTERPTCTEIKNICLQVRADRSAVVGLRNLSFEPAANFKFASSEVHFNDAIVVVLVVHQFTNCVGDLKLQKTKQIWPTDGLLDN
ncbi:hypothetical protein SCHPADRAFT_942084 [Schizopora paradoxa]|uniref:Uncharacterized protein n=1 Tax=Schizopora paradoxa TaxID=27342 RepID=A0A0H2RHR3_9AGAM|nr:hypothetical protein SCHPADRAFT_942084 [Schizopora paradoxa]